MMRAVRVTEITQVGEARRAAVAAATGLGFGEEDAGRVAIVTTELATNLIKHGGGGEFLVGTFDDRTGTGVECLALDKGIGIANFAESRCDGQSTAGTQGTGLGAIARGSHVFDIYSRPGTGTAILARCKQGRPTKAATEPEPISGAVNLPMPGETACGDAWCIKTHAHGFKLMVADGLGHGPIAAEASGVAVSVFDAEHARPPGEILNIMHNAMRSTRGAAVSICDLDSRRGNALYAGIGNVAGALVSGGVTRRMVSHNGTVGLIARKIQEFSYPFEGEPLVVLCSDGLGTRWDLADYPGLAARHPTLIAGVLYRDFTRGRDDVGVLVARHEAG